jgi:hypothetical protein
MRSAPAVLFLCLAFFANPLFAADETAASVSSSVSAVLNVTAQQFLSAAEAMPENLYSFAPPGAGFKGVRTFGEQVKHVACGNFAFFNAIEGKTPPPHCEKGGPAEASTRSELLAYLRESFAYGNKVLAAMSDKDALTRTAKGPYWGGSTRLTVAVAAVWHISDHYGQIVPYLRMNGILPPTTQQHPLAVR